MKNFLRSAFLLQNKEIGKRDLTPLYIFTSGLFIVGLAAYTAASLPYKVRENRREVLAEAFRIPYNFEGVPRPKGAQEVSEKINNNLIVVFGPHNTGKTYFSQYLAHYLQPRSVLYIKWEGSATEVFRHLGFSDPIGKT